MRDVDKYGGIQTENLNTISNFNPRKNRYFLAAGDIIMISKGYNLDAFVIPTSLEGAIVSNTFMHIKPDRSKITSAYLAWFLNSNRTQHYFKSLAAGTNIPSLSIRALKGVKLTLPTISQQKHIAELEKLKKSKITIHQTIAEKTEQMINALLQKQVDSWTSKNKKSIIMSKKNYDVSPNGDQWQVKRHGNKGATRNFDTQKEAISYGREQAKESKGELYIKNRKGQVREANSYGKDPHPPKG